MAHELLDTDIAGLEPELHWAPGTSPVEQASRWVPERMYEWQVKGLRDCMVRGARKAIVTPNEAGKTSVFIPVLGLSFMAAFPGCQVVSTAGVIRQIERALWPKLRSAVGRYRWSVSDDRMQIRAPSVRGVEPSEWISFTTRDPEYAEGFHSKWFVDDNGDVVYAPLVVIIDEGKSFDSEEMIFALVERCDPDVALFISTPGEDSGPFYDAFHKNKGKPWDTTEVTWQDCPHLLKGVKLKIREDRIERMGSDHPLVLSSVFGKFYRSGGRYVFDKMDDVREAMSGKVPWVRGRDGRRGAVEFSGGGDEQVFGVRDGNKIFPLEVFHEKDDVKLVDILVGCFRKWNLKPEDITADNGGAGKTCIDMLAAKGYPGIRRYMFGDPANDKSLYATKAMEDHYELRTKIAQQSIVLPPDVVLEEQMRKRQFLIKNENNVMQLEPKKRLRDRGESSPDRLDTVVMLTCDMEPITFDEMRDHRRETLRNKCGDYMECYQDPVDESTATWASDGFMT